MFASPVYLTSKPDFIGYAQSLFDRCPNYSTDANGIQTTISGGDYSPGRCRVLWNVLDEPDIGNFLSMIKGSTEDFLNENHYCEYQIQVANMWLLGMKHGTQNPPHTHYGYSLSGTYYISCPENSSGIQFHSDLELGLGHVLKPKLQTESNSMNYVLKVGPGDLVIFPSWLRHSVPINRHQGYRKSIAFDLLLHPNY